jgi:hypothetical protein
MIQKQVFYFILTIHNSGLFTLYNSFMNYFNFYKDPLTATLYSYILLIFNFILCLTFIIFLLDKYLNLIYNFLQSFFQIWFNNIINSGIIILDCYNFDKFYFNLTMMFLKYYDQMFFKISILKFYKIEIICCNRFYLIIFICKFIINWDVFDSK